ncbi:hypothetical protein [Vibrio sp. R78045]|uniref:hypothetical protein n=1 Tax=Vibrio sp. R78045 TaxID=3093868 RepID=UPI0036F3AF96
MMWILFLLLVWYLLFKSKKSNSNATSPRTEKIEMDWSKYRNNRFIMGIAVYVPVQLAMLILSFFINWVIPIGEWCVITPENQSSPLMLDLELTNCNLKQYAYILRASIVISLVIGMFGVMFPSKVSNFLNKHRKSS